MLVVTKLVATGIQSIVRPPLRLFPLVVTLFLRPKFLLVFLINILCIVRISGQIITTKNVWKIYVACHCRFYYKVKNINSWRLSTILTHTLFLCLPDHCVSPCGRDVNCVVALWKECTRRLNTSLLTSGPSLRILSAIWEVHIGRSLIYGQCLKSCLPWEKQTLLSEASLKFVYNASQGLR